MKKTTVASFHFNDLGLTIAYRVGSKIKYLLADPFQASLLMCDTKFIKSRRKDAQGRLMVSKAGQWMPFSELHRWHPISVHWAEKFVQRHEDNLLFKTVLTDIVFLPDSTRLN